jgi:hypothetical protein
MGVSYYFNRPQRRYWSDGNAPQLFLASLRGTANEALTSTRVQLGPPSPGRESPGQNAGGTCGGLNSESPYPAIPLTRQHALSPPRSFGMRRRHPAIPLSRYPGLCCGGFIPLSRFDSPCRRSRSSRRARDAPAVCFTSQTMFNIDYLHIRAVSYVTLN